jgi:hypothetical protein
MEIKICLKKCSRQRDVYTVSRYLCRETEEKREHVTGFSGQTFEHVTVVSVATTGDCGVFAYFTQIQVLFRLTKRQINTTDRSDSVSASADFIHSVDFHALFVEEL